jgi:hypothetical protein
LRSGTGNIVIPVEGVEGAQDSPASAQVFIGIVEEAANISTSLIGVSKNESRIIGWDLVGLPLVPGRMIRIEEDGGSR